MAAATSFFDDFSAYFGLTNSAYGTETLGTMSYNGDVPTGSTRQVYITNINDGTTEPGPVTAIDITGTPDSFEMRIDNQDPSLVNTVVSNRYRFPSPFLMLANGVYLNKVIPGYTGASSPNMTLEVIVYFQSASISNLIPLPDVIDNLCLVPSDPNWTGGDAVTLFATETIHTIDFNLASERTNGAIVQLLSGIGGDPHVLCMDGTRLDVYKPGFYRFYDNCSADPSKRLIANLEVQQDEKTGSDHAAALWVQNGMSSPVEYRFNGKLWSSTITVASVKDGEGDQDGEGGAVRKDSMEHSVYDMQIGASMTFVLEGAYNTLGIKCRHPKKLMDRHCMLGGLLAGQIVRLTALDDTMLLTRVSMITLSTAIRGAHALICGSSNPHIVSFSGANVQTKGFAKDETMLCIQTTSSGQVLLLASFDTNGYIQKLVVHHGSAKVFSASWKDGAVSVDGIALLGCPSTIYDDDKFAEAFVPAAGGLRIRVQPASVASFSVKNKSVLDDATGELVERLDPSRKGTGKAGFYSMVIEPHLCAAVDVAVDKPHAAAATVC
jgi:hypothetical protein